MTVYSLTKFIIQHLQDREVLQFVLYEDGFGLLFQGFLHSCIFLQESSGEVDSEVLHMKILQIQVSNMQVLHMQVLHIMTTSFFDDTPVIYM